MTIRPLLAAAAACLSISAGSAWSADPKAAKFYEDALTRYEKRDLPGAIIQLKNALKIDSSMLSAHLLLGKTLLQNGEVAAAEVAFTEAQRLGVSRSEVVVPMARAVVAQGKPQEVIEQQRFQTVGLPGTVQADLLLIKAGAYTDVGDPRSALKAIEEARLAAPALIDPWLAEVPLRIRSRQLKEARVAIDKARSLQPAAPDVHYHYGTTLHVQGDLNGALAAYDKALAADADHLDARLARAGINVDLRRFDSAAKDVATLLDKRPLEPRGWYLSGLLAEREGKLDQVRKALTKITDLLDPVPIEYIRYRPQILLLAGQAHYGLGQFEKARPLFEAFERVQPGTPVSKLLANILLAQKDFDRAVESLESYLRGHGSDTQAMALLASAHMAKGRNARAASLMQEALRSKDAPELYTAYGLSLMGIGQGGSAITQLEQAYRKDPNQTHAAYALAGLYLRERQSQKAVAIANSLVSGQPGNASFHNLLGLAKSQVRDPAGARAAFEKAVQLDPTLSQATLNLARLDMAAKAFDRARTLLDNVLKADEQNTEAMFEQAALAEQVGKPAEALRWLQKAFDVAGTKDLRSSLALVDLHMRQGRPQEALKVAQQISAAVPDNLPVVVAMARAQLATGDVAGAKNNLTSATRLANFDPQIQVEIALLQLAVQNMAGAEYSLNKALTGKPGHLPALAMLNDIDIRKGEFAKAEARAAEIIKREPKLPLGHSLLGDIALIRGKPAQAVEHYRRAHALGDSTETFVRMFRTQATVDARVAVTQAQAWLKQRPKDLTVGRLLAQLHVRMGNMAGARAEYERLRALVPADAGILNDLANVLLRLKDASALAVAEQALAAAPGNVVATDTLGWAAFQAGQVDRAVQLLRDARLRNPDSAEIRYHLATALAKAGRHLEAREELHAALRGGDFEGRTDAEALLRTLR